MNNEFSHSTLIRQYLSWNSAIVSCKKFIPHPCKQLAVIKYFLVNYVLMNRDLAKHFSPSDVRYCTNNCIEAGLLVRSEINGRYKITNKGKELIECFDRAYLAKYNKIRFRANPIPLQD